MEIDWDLVGGALIFLFLLVGFSWAIVMRFFGVVRCPNCRKWVTGRKTHVSEEWNYRHRTWDAVQLYHFQCKNCQHEWEREEPPYPYPD